MLGELAPQLEADHVGRGTLVKVRPRCALLERGPAAPRGRAQRRPSPRRRGSRRDEPQAEHAGRWGRRQDHDLSRADVARLGELRASDHAKLVGEAAGSPRGVGAGAPGVTWCAYRSARSVLPAAARERFGARPVVNAPSCPARMRPPAAPARKPNRPALSSGFIIQLFRDAPGSRAGVGEQAVGQRPCRKRCVPFVP